jgi:predicted nucleic acid-binding protein
MIVVADASPLHYLILVGHVEVLSQVFDRVLVPPAVVSELSRRQTPEPVRRWMTSPPHWLEIKTPAAVLEVLGLGAGEREAISLAREMRAESVLIDDRDAFKEARKHGLTVLGTLAVLDNAASRGFIPDLPETVERLVMATNFRMNRTTEMIIERMLQRDYERKQALENDREKQGRATPE